MQLISQTLLFWSEHSQKKFAGTISISIMVLKSKHLGFGKNLKFLQKSLEMNANILTYNGYLGNLSVKMNVYNFVNNRVLEKILLIDY